MKIKWHVTSQTQFRASVDGFSLLVEGSTNGPFLAPPWHGYVSKNGAPSSEAWKSKACNSAEEAKTEASTEVDRALARPHLERFTTDGIMNDTQKKALKKQGWIDYRHAMWGLTKAGVAEAERLGYL